ncbi:MAG: hypothetical protein HN559_00555 [Gemmatimonadetes bacterium]|nr:hypothetical protein [Gemmatimonadota bacterium]
MQTIVLPDFVQHAEEKNHDKRKLGTPAATQGNAEECADQRILCEVHQFGRVDDDQLPGEQPEGAAQNPGWDQAAQGKGPKGRGFVYHQKENDYRRQTQSCREDSFTNKETHLAPRIAHRSG